MVVFRILIDLIFFNTYAQRDYSIEIIFVNQDEKDLFMIYIYIINNIFFY
ncbi:hypothetical protein BGAPBR_F0001 (plasmid) [Borreliella garinii PBr]|uniref:Uncharacterized protein n=1 Tax=Borreliella garinii PBr TaxID=498743 RepID=B8F1S6_BORGR|nr:hypothetical protein BGAPBR_F0001 [Borreliella garinii PBr]